MKTGYEVARIKRSVRKDERQKVIAEVLEIIDEVAADNLIDDAIKINSVRNRVQMWLKEGEQE